MSRGTALGQNGSPTSVRCCSGSVLPAVGVGAVNVVHDSRPTPSVLVMMAIEYSAPTGWRSHPQSELVRK
jgi:hypothetical protein